VAESTPIAVHVALVAATIAPIKSQVTTVVVDVTNVTPNIPPVGTQLCS
jgi:hypothetical protein